MGLPLFDLGYLCISFPTKWRIKKNPLFFRIKKLLPFSKNRPFFVSVKLNKKKLVSLFKKYIYFKLVFNSYSPIREQL